MKIWGVLLAVIALAGCGSSADEDYDSGYSDGYATGYNTTCKIRATLVKGDWDNKDYKRGYDAGYSAGAAACRRSSDWKGS